MSITIYRQLSIQDLMVQVPPDLYQHQLDLIQNDISTIIPGAKVVGDPWRHSRAARRNVRLVQLPGVSPDGWYSSDPIEALQALL